MAYLILRLNIILKKLSINYYFWIADLWFREFINRDIFKERCLENLLSMRDCLDSINIPYWLTDGTLLGFYRDKDFIINDIDVDLGIHISSLDERLIDICKANGFNMLRYSGQKDYGLEYTFTRKGCNIDLFFFYDKDDYVWHGAWRHGEIIRFKYPRFNLQKVMFKGHQFSAPDNIEEYLILKYGDNWKTPIGKWDWARDPKNIF
jgi:fukutin